MRVTSVDLGNFDVKYKSECARGSFSSKISTEFRAYEVGFERVEVNGQTTYIGIGELNKEFNKSSKNYLPQLLYTISKANAFASDITTNLGLMLPSTQMKDSAKIIEELKNKRFKATVNGSISDIIISDVIVLPEGLSAFYSQQSRDCAVIDFGSRTINVAIYENAKLVKLETIKMGTYDFYSRIKNIQHSKGKDYTEEDIQRLIDENIIQVDKSEYMNFFKDVLNALKPIVALGSRNNIFVGGGSLLFKEFIEIVRDKAGLKVSVLDSMSNVEGLYNVCCKTWRNK